MFLNDQYPSYWLARGWEKMDIVEEEQGDYDIHFRVSVSTNRGGTILIGDQTVSSANIKKGEAVSIKIVPDKEHEIDRVILNGKRYYCRNKKSDLHPIVH